MIAQAKPLVSVEHVVHVLGTAAVFGECAVCFDENKTLVAASFSCAHTPVCCKDCMSLVIDFAVEERPYMKTIACSLKEGCEVITII